MDKFDKWISKSDNKTICNFQDGAKAGWNASVGIVLRRIRYLDSQFEGNWQHEDIDMLIDFIKELETK